MTISMTCTEDRRTRFSQKT